MLLISLQRLRTTVLYTALCLLIDSSPQAFADSVNSAKDAKEVSFQQDILPQLMERCSYCHQAYDRQGYLVLEEETAYQTLVNVSSYQLPSMKRIKPGDADNSYVWLKGTNQHLEAGGYGWNMPIGWGLYGPFKDQLYLWIEQGAKNN